MADRVWKQMLSALLLGIVMLGCIWLLPDPRDTSSPAFTQNYAVKVYSVGTEGSGVVVGSLTYNVIDGHSAVHSLILTCAHVVTTDGTISAPSSLLIMRDGKTYKGHVVIVDAHADLALIDVAQHWPSVHLYTGKIDPGMKEITVGYPLGTHLQISPVGFVGQMNTIHDLGSIGLKHPAAREGSAPMWPGNSGGAIYVATHDGWRFAGLAQMIHEYPVMVSQTGAAFIHAPSVSYFITADTIAKFLKAQHVE